MELRLEAGASSAEGTRYYTHGGQTVAMRTPEGVQHLADDHQSTAQIAVDDATQTATIRRFTPFGAERGTPTGSWPGEKGFVGGTIDASTGLTHLGAREYDPATGRFISVDPVLNPDSPQQMNGYSYADNSPVTFSDPTGLCAPGIGCATNPRARSGNGGNRSTDRDCAYWTAWGGCGSGRSGPPSSYVPPVKKPSAGRRATDFLEKANDFMGGLNLAYTKYATPVGALFLIPGFQDWLTGKMGLNDESDAYKWGERTFDIISLVAGGGSLVKTAAGLVRSGAGGLARKVLGSCKNSFVPGTRVVMAGGLPKPIEDVKAGDKVIATDPDTGDTRAQTVSATITSVGEKNLVDIFIATDGDRGDDTGKVTATDEHPFWVAGDIDKWIKAADLEPGMWLRTSAGTYVQITATHTRETPLQRVHNLTITGTHTYYVLTGPSSALVHNCPPTDADVDPNIVYRALGKGEDPALGLVARDPSAVGVTPLSHVAGKRASPWISTSKLPSVAFGKYNGGHGVVAIDLSKVAGRIEDISGGFPGKGRFDRWARKDKEVLIFREINSDAIIGFWS